MVMFIKDAFVELQRIYSHSIQNKQKVYRSFTITQSAMYSDFLLVIAFSNGNVETFFIGQLYNYKILPHAILSTYMSQITILQCCNVLIDDQEIQALLVGSKWSKFLLIVQLPTLQVIQRIFLEEEFKKAERYFVPYSYYASYIIAYKNKQYLKMPLSCLQVKCEQIYEHNTEIEELMKKGGNTLTDSTKMTLEKLKIENKKQRDVRKKAAQISTQLRERNIPHKVIKRVLNHTSVQRKFYGNETVKGSDVDEVLEKVRNDADEEPVISSVKDIDGQEINSPGAEAMHPKNDEKENEQEPQENTNADPEEVTEQSQDGMCLEEFTVRPEEALQIFEEDLKLEEKETETSKENESQKAQNEGIEQENKLRDQKQILVDDIDENQQAEESNGMVNRESNLIVNVNDQIKDITEQSNDILNDQNSQNQQYKQDTLDQQKDKENTQPESQVNAKQDQELIQINQEVNEEHLSEKDNINDEEEVQNDETHEENEIPDKKEDLLFHRSHKQKQYTDNQKEEANKMIEELKQYVINEEDSDCAKITQVRLKKCEEIKQMRRSFEHDDFKRDDFIEESDGLSDSSAQFVTIDDEDTFIKKQSKKQRKNKKGSILEYLKLPPKPDNQGAGKKQKKKNKKRETVEQNNEYEQYEIVPDATLTSTTMLFDQNILEPLKQSELITRRKHCNFQFDSRRQSDNTSTHSKSQIQSSTSQNSSYCAQPQEEEEYHVVRIETTKKNIGTIVKQSGKTMIDEFVENDNKRKIKLAQFLRSLEDKNLLKQRNIKYTKNSLEYKIYKQKLQYQKFKIKKSISAPDIQLKFVMAPQSQLEFKPGYQSVLPCNPIINMLYGRANLRTAQQIQELDLQQKYDVKFGNLDLSPGKFLYGRYFIDLLDTTVQNDVLQNYNIEFMKLIIPAMQGIFESGYGIAYDTEKQEDQYELFEDNVIDCDLSEINTQLKLQKELEKEFMSLDVFDKTQLYPEFLPLYINKFNALFRKHIPQVFVDLIKQQIQKGKPVRLNDIHTYPVCYVWAYYLKFAGISIYNYFKQHIQPKKSAPMQENITLQQVCRAHQISNTNYYTQCYELLNQTQENLSQQQQEQRQKIMYKLEQVLPKQQKKSKKKALNFEIINPMNKIFDKLKEQEFSFQDISYKPNAHLYEISLFLNIFFNGFENKINQYIIRRSKDLLSSLNQHQIEFNSDPMPSFNDIVISSLTQAEMMKQLEYSENIELWLKKEAFYPQQDVQQTLLINKQCITFQNTPGNFSVYIKPQKLFQDQADVHIIDVLVTLGYKTDVEAQTQLGLIDFQFLTLFIQFIQKQLNVSMFYYQYAKQIVENDKFQPEKLFQLLTNIFLINDNDIIKTFNQLILFEYTLVINNNYYLALSRYSQHLKSSEQYFLQEFLDRNQKNCFITYEVNIENEKPKKIPIKHQKSIIKNSIQNIEIKDPKITQENAYIMDQITAYTKQRPQLRVQAILSRKGTRNVKQNRLNTIIKPIKSNHTEDQASNILSNNIDFFVENPFTEYKKQLALLCQDPDFWKQDEDINVL